MTSIIAQNSKFKVHPELDSSASNGVKNHSSKLKTEPWLGLLRDATQIDKDEINEFLKKTEEIQKYLGKRLNDEGKR